jgi:hypothetical protein
MAWPMGNPLGIGAGEQYRVAPITYRPTVISATPAVSGGPPDNMGQEMAVFPVGPAATH